MQGNRLSAHIGYLFTELPLIERIAAAAEAGFTAIEHPQPFAISAPDMRKELSRHCLVISQLAAAVGDAGKGEKGLAALPGRETDFRKAFDHSLEYAIAVDCPFVHPMAGIPSMHESAAVATTYHRNLSYALERTANTSVKLLIEAISEAAIPRYAMATLDHASRVQDAFGPGNVALLVDTFHARTNGIDLPTWIGQNHHRIGHVHIADHPGRHEPGTGTITFEPILDELLARAYQGAIGFEYVPSETKISSAAFLPRWKKYLASKNQGTDRRRHDNGNQSEEWCGNGTL